ncbi:SRPBCC domain-containing protein [Mycolicibacterium sp. P9-64]|uniref:SRPBCC domain-containing protein n=1 Tax=Mycolicibacterium sp. P9-64 TaxID=2024612 RepID=UPI0018D888A6|nr:SRPBCC domain-containing protein [Mycolicibacterium sp. P9-64]
MKGIRDMIKKTNWPARFHPAVSSLYALNDIDVKAPLEVVWNLLIDAHNWSKYYPHANDVEITTGDSVLSPGARFTWTTAGFSLVSVVQDFVPGERLGWDTFFAEGHDGASAYHGWVITPTDDGCHLLTEETQQGAFLVEELAIKNPGTLHNMHQEWVENLARAAEAKVATNLVNQTR